MRFSVLTMTAAAALSLATGAAAQKAAAPAAIAFEKGNEDASSLQEAFEAAFTTQVSGANTGFEKSIGDAKYTFKPVALYRVSGNIYALLSTGSSDNDGHAASGTNAIHYLRSAEGGWQKTGEWFDLGGSGTWGNGATEWQLTRALGKNPYLLTSGGGTWQGCTVSNVVLTELAPAGPKDRGRFIDHNSWTEGETEARNFSHDGTISSAAKDRSFTVTYSGTKRISQQYVRKGEKYELVGKDQIPGC